jgi:alkylation response protein AidB-like acyl-CoA dehydrogenase
MDFNLTEEQEAIRKTAREFAEKEIRPVAAEYDLKEEFPWPIVKKLAELGFLGMIIPEKYGGTGAGNVALALTIMEVSRVCASTGVTLSVHNSLLSNPLLKFSTEEQKKKYLPKLASGEWIGAYALTESTAGSDAAALKTTAVKKGDRYILNGSKVWITNAGVADVIITFAVTDKEARRGHNITAFILEKDFKGFNVGTHEKKLGVRAADTVELSYADLEVPEENLLGEYNEGFKIAMDTLDGGRIGIASQACGIAMGCLEESAKYARERKQFGKPIGAFQPIQWMIAEMAMELDAAKLLTLRAAHLKDLGVRHTIEASMAKLFSSTACNKAANNAVQIFGGYGYTKEYPVERFYRDAKITELYEGTSEIQNIVISRAFLRD